MSDFAIHNLFKKSLDEFKEYDPHLMRLKNLPYVYRSGMEDEIPLMVPGIYILTGGRQIGKSTLLKLMILRLLNESKIAPAQIYYLPCDTIDNYKQLLFEIEQFQQQIKQGEYFCLFIDEITYVREWDRAVKYLADTGFFFNGSVLITGSDSVILKEAMMRFPGRRGMSPKQDFHIHPLSFFEYVSLQDKNLAASFAGARDRFNSGFQIEAGETGRIAELFGYFDKYLLTGGYVVALNDHAKNNLISPAVYKTYAQWIVGDMLKKGKQESYLKEIIRALIPRIAKQITLHNITAEMSIEHHQTVANYFNILEQMDVIFIQYALREDKFQAAIKKAKKVNFCDPFVFHAMHAWEKNMEDCFALTQKICSENSDMRNSMIEGVISSLFKRRFDTYYIKAEQEVDIALVSSKKIFPIEIKCSLVLNKKDLKQIIKYKKGIVGYRGQQVFTIDQLDVVPIPLLALLAV